VSEKAGSRRKSVEMACPAVLFAVRDGANFGLRTLLRTLSLLEGFQCTFRAQQCLKDSTVLCQAYSRLCTAFIVSQACRS
jgi:hypothetical protein